MRMLIRRRLAMPAASARGAGIAALLAVAATATGAAAGSTAGYAGRVDARPPLESQVAYGGAATLFFKTAKLGLLHVQVEAVTTALGTTTSVVYRRQTGCQRAADSGVAKPGTCRVAWIERRELDANAFTVNPALDEGRLSDTLRGLSVRVTWTGAGQVETVRDPHAQVVGVERFGDADVTWGTVHSEDTRWHGAPFLYREARVSVP